VLRRSYRAQPAEDDQDVSDVMIGGGAYSEAKIARMVEIDRKRVPIRNKHPLTNVKLSVCDYQRILDVLLDDPLRAGAWYLQSTACN
jgi:hypothetical protein